MKKIISTIIYCLFFIQMPTLFAQKGMDYWINYLKETDEKEKKTLHDVVTYVINSAATQKDSLTNIDTLMRAVPRFGLFKLEENRLKPLLIKNMNLNYQSRKVLLLFDNTAEVLQQLNALCQHDSVEVRARLGDKNALIDIDSAIQRIIKADVFNDDIYKLYVTKLIYIDNKASHKILEYLLGSDINITGKCKYGWKMSKSLFCYTLNHLNQQYRDINLGNFEEDSEYTYNSFVRFKVPLSFRERFEKVIIKDYDMKVTINIYYFIEHSVSQQFPL